MSFERLSAVTTYLLVGTGFLVLFLSGELPPVFWLFVLPAVAATAIWGTRPQLQSAWLWNGILLVGLLLMVAMGLSTGDWLSAAIYFASLMVVAKLFQRRSSGDYFQLYVLSFLQLVAGAVINPTLSFAVCFLLYVVLLTWALVMLHLRRDLERLADVPDDSSTGGAAVAYAPATAGWALQRLIGPGFLAGTSLLALAIFACSIVVFLFFPRLGLGFFGAHRRTGNQVSGFGDQVNLDDFGRLKMDQTVMMRVEIQGAEARDVLPLRMKGITFDEFDGKRRWTKSKAPTWELAANIGGGFVGVDSPGLVPDDAVRFSQLVYLEHMQIDRKVVFGESRVEAVRDLRGQRYVYNWRKRTKFFQDADLDLSYQTTASPLRYEVRSVRVGRPAEALRRADGDVPWRLVRPYLQVPDDLDPRVAPLAARVAAGKDTDFDRVLAIERHLTSSYRYSLEGGHDDADPLGDFLFGRRSGHCEFFATAMTMMVRSLGIPARVAGGFFGGQYNDVGDYIAIRQADAHSWVEVYFPQWGWIVFEPTPPGGALAEPDDGFWARVGRYFDSLELSWHKWVIRWDLEQQIELFRAIGRKLAGLGNLMPSGAEGGLGESMSWLRERLSWRVLLWIVLGLGVIVLFVLRRRLVLRRSPGRRRGRAARSRDQKRARRLYERLLRMAARRGVDVTPATTPGRVLGALEGQSTEVAALASRLLRIYEDVVFGAEPLDPAAVRECRQVLVGLKQTT